MGSQFVNDGLNSKHKQLVTQVESKLEIIFSRAIIEQSV